MRYVYVLIRVDYWDSSEYVLRVYSEKDKASSFCKDMNDNPESIDFYFVKAVEYVD